MAPHWPDEVDVFTVPHTRMKKLIHQYNDLVMTTDFRDELHLRSLLQNLHHVFCELKAHEHIENTYIMKELRSKLRAASISDPAVCNCHSDNRLTDMMDLVLDGYKWAEKPQRERQMYGRKLRHALDDFTQNFLPHMDMEEQVFQPMLMEYFSYDELKALKTFIIKQHGIEKYVADSYESEEFHFDRLPDEVCLQILSFLGPQDLCRTSQVSRRMANMARYPKLWRGIFPVHWTSGNWSFHPASFEEEESSEFIGQGKWSKERLYYCTDEDADVDESSCDSDRHTSQTTDSEEGRLKDMIREDRLLRGIVKHLLPKVGPGVKRFHLAYSRGINNNIVHKILKLCPNIEMIDLRHTLVGDAAFREYVESGRQLKLRHLDLSGCENITDQTLYCLASQTLSEDEGGDSSRNKDKLFADKESKKDVFGDANELKQDTSHQHVVSQDDLEIENVPKRCASKNMTLTQKSLEGATVSQCSSNMEVDKMLDKQGFTATDKKCCGDRESCCDKKEEVDENTCDLSYVYLDMLIQSDEEGQVLQNLSRMRVNDESIDFRSPVQQTQLPTSFGSSQTYIFTQNRESRSASQAFWDSYGEQSSHATYFSESDYNPSESESIATGSAAFYLEFLSLSGCYRVTSDGISALSKSPGMPHLRHLDLSGCVNVHGDSLRNLVMTAPSLDHADLYYCDNLPGDPFPSTASGCKNKGCCSLYCCSMVD